MGLLNSGVAEEQFAATVKWLNSQSGVASGTGVKLSTGGLILSFPPGTPAEARAATIKSVLSPTLTPNQVENLIPRVDQRGSSESGQNRWQATIEPKYLNPDIRPHVAAAAAKQSAHETSNNPNLAREPHSNRLSDVSADNAKLDRMTPELERILASNITDESFRSRVSVNVDGDRMRVSLPATNDPSLGHQISNALAEIAPNAKFVSTREGSLVSLDVSMNQLSPALKSDAKGYGRIIEPPQQQGQTPPPQQQGQTPPQENPTNRPSTARAFSAGLFGTLGAVGVYEPISNIGHNIIEGNYAAAAGDSLKLGAAGTAAYFAGAPAAGLGAAFGAAAAPVVLGTAGGTAGYKLAGTACDFLGLDPEGTASSVIKWGCGAVGAAAGAALGFVPGVGQAAGAAVGGAGAALVAGGTAASLAVDTIQTARHLELPNAKTSATVNFLSDPVAAVVSSIDSGTRTLMWDISGDEKYRPASRSATHTASAVPAEPSTSYSPANSTLHPSAATQLARSIATFSPLAGPAALLEGYIGKGMDMNLDALRQSVDAGHQAIDNTGMTATAQPTDHKDQKVPATYASNDNKGTQQANSRG